MNTHTNIAGVLLAGFALATVSPALAVSNITIADKATDLNWFVGDGSTTGAGKQVAGFIPGYGTQPLSPGGEDNETERVGTLTAIAGQAWDMEAFVRNGTKLSIVTGYDMLNGRDGGRPGDLFIKIGGEPSGNPTTSAPLTVQNGIAAAGYLLPYNYSFAVDLSLKAFVGTDMSGVYGADAAAGAAGTFGGTTTTSVYDLNAASYLHTVENDGFKSNPWKYENDSVGFTNSKDAVLSTAIKYDTGLTTANLVTRFGAGYGFQGTLHNVLEIDLGFLGTIAPGTTVWFSYTMECGNDSLKGLDSSGFDIHVPDNTTSSMLIGFSFVLMSLLRLKRRQA